LILARHLASLEPESRAFRLSIDQCVIIACVMRLRKLLASLVLLAPGLILAAPPTPVPSAVDAERLVRVYANLKNSEQMASTGVTTDMENLITEARVLPANTLKKECATTLDRCLTAYASAPPNRRPETFSYMKNAMLRLTRNREENPSDHLQWAADHRDKVSAAFHECARGLKDALAKM
jgi:hypothetical protein